VLVPSFVQQGTNTSTYRSEKQMRQQSSSSVFIRYLLPFICIVILGSGTLMYSPLVIPYTMWLGGLAVHGTYIEGLSKFIACLGVVYIGYLSTFLGRKKTLLYIYLFGAIGSATAAFAPNPILLLCASTISSLSFASMSAVMMTYLAEIAPKDRQATAMGVFGTGIGCSAAIGAVLSTSLAEQYGFRLPFALAAILICLGALLIYLFFIDNSVSSVVIKNTCRGFSGLKLLQLLPGMGFPVIVLYLSAFAYQFSQSSLSTLLSPLVVHLQYPLSVAGIGIGTYGLFGIMQPLGGRFSDQFGRKLGIIAGSALFLIGLIFVSAAQSAGILLLGTSLFGVGTSLFMPSIGAAIYNSVSDDMKGVTMGLFQSILTVGAVLGPVGGGIVLQAAGPRSPFVLNSIVAGLALVLLVVKELCNTESRKKPAV
jgi:MFS family permease